MYILLLDGLLPKFVTCTSEAAFAGAPNVTAAPNPATASVTAHAASRALSRLFILLPFPWAPSNPPRFHRLTATGPEMFRMCFSSISLYRTRRLLEGNCVVLGVHAAPSAGRA